jgi:hypothetical protein
MIAGTAVGAIDDLLNVALDLQINRYFGRPFDHNGLQ